MSPSPLLNSYWLFLLLKFNGVLVAIGIGRSIEVQVSLKFQYPSFITKTDIKSLPVDIILLF